MNDKIKTYANAGAQTQQAWREMQRYGGLPDDALVTLKTVSLVLGINRNKVSHIPVQPVMVEKRKCYRKGDIAQWVAHDFSQPESLLERLRAQQAKAFAKILKEPSRRYAGGRISKEEAKLAREKTKANVGSPFSADEKAGGWDKGLARRRNSPILPPKPMTEAEASMEGSVSHFVRELLKASELK